MTSERLSGRDAATRDPSSTQLIGLDLAWSPRNNTAAVPSVRWRVKHVGWITANASGTTLRYSPPFAE